ncbi:MAG: hypothetical protein ABI855_05475 [Bacteroidota bacterium]
MKKITWKFILFFFLTSNFCNAQIKILFLTGKMKEVKQYEVKGDWVFYKKMNDKKDKLRKMDKFDIFSAINPDGTEEVIYDPDTALEGDPSVERVRNYIKGEQYAKSVYNAPWNKFESEVVGLGSGIFTFYGPAGVFINSLITGQINARKIPYTSSIEPAILYSDDFKVGYKKYARNKKIKDSLIFGGIGFTIGFTFFTLIFQ